ncbi:MAG: YfcE family phosphodiesterase [Clostridia bacterium]|nr:YfcE family phosphodiesterase [Clostridia bacterium]
MNAQQTGLDPARSVRGRAADKIIVVFSDSHGDPSNMIRVMKRYPTAECVIHLGDGADDTYYLPLPVTTGLLCVRGNCDLFSSEPAYNRVNICGLDIIMSHGSAYGVKYGADTFEAHALASGCDIALFGHTHKPYKNVLSAEGKSVTVFNPGSISRPASGPPSYGLITVTDRGCEIKHVVL